MNLAAQDAIKVQLAALSQLRDNELADLGARLAVLPQFAVCPAKSELFLLLVDLGGAIDEKHTLFLALAGLWNVAVVWIQHEAELGLEIRLVLELVRVDLGILKGIVQVQRLLIVVVGLQNDRILVPVDLGELVAETAENFPLAMDFLLKLLTEPPELELSEKLTQKEDIAA